MAQDTILEFDAAIKRCRDIFVAKLGDYGASWRIMRPSSITDQIFIKAKRIRQIEETGENRVGESVIGEFIAIVNYGIIGLIQLAKGWSDHKDISTEEAVALYDKFMGDTRELMLRKNHDYDEAWRGMRVSSYTDLILTKIERTKEIEQHHGATVVSEGIDANYKDMVNYAVFGIIKLS